MITNIFLTKGYGKGYLRKGNSPMVQPFFPTANMAIRKETFEEVGPFDTVCKTSGEDVDLCIRVANTKWELFFEPRATVYHKHRTSLKGVFKQWFGYGTFHPHIFKKHNPKCVEIIYQTHKTALGWYSKRMSSIFGLPVPFHVLIFVTPFHLLNACLGLALLAAVIKSPWLFKASLAAWLLGAVCFWGKPFFQNVILKGRVRWIIYSLIRYLLNWVYVLGALLAGLKIGVLYLDVTREEPI